MNSVRAISLRSLLWKAGLLASIMSLLGTTIALAASGALDTSFHSTGKLLMDFSTGQSSTVRAIDVGSNGTIVAAGDTRLSSTNYNFAVARMTSKGALDSTFNSSGKASIDFGGVDQAMALFIAPATSKVVVAGNKCSTNGLTCDVATARFNSNGTLDTRWNNTGKRVDNFGSGDNRATAIAVQSDGYVVVAGYMYNGSDYDFAVMRYDNRGDLDPNFGGTGKKAIPFGAGRNDQAFAVAIQGDGKIVVAGKSCDAGMLHCSFAVVRLKSGGLPDTTFSGDGKVVAGFGSMAYASGVAVQSNGKIVVAGSREALTGTAMALARYNSNGSLDTTFSGDGKLAVSVSGAGNSLGTAVGIVPSSQKIVVAGSNAGNFAVVRLRVGGALDTGFNGTGKVTVNFGGDDFCNALVIQPADSRYLLGGWSNDGSLNHWALTRILP